MDIKKIEDMYQKAQYKEIIDTVSKWPDAIDNEHIRRLYVRSANRIGESVNGYLIEGMPDNDLDLAWNRMQFKEGDGSDMLDLLRNVLIDGREDIVEDIIITYLDRYGHMPINHEMLKYCADNAQRPVVQMYLNMINDGLSGVKALIAARILNEDVSTLIVQLKQSHPFIKQAYDKFLLNTVSSETIEQFLSALSFKSGNFFILDGNIMQIKGLNEADGSFTVQTKTGQERKIPFDRVIERTNPIDENDFRVYKFFKPQAAKEMEPCELLVSIIKYHGNAIDRDTLKKELVYIYGADAVKYYTSKRKVFEQCPGIHVIYGKNERYSLTDDDNNAVIAHIKRLNEENKVRDYIIETCEKSAIEEEHIKEILDMTVHYKGPFKGEIGYLLTGDGDYADSIEENAFEQIRSAAFTEAVILSRIKKRQYDNELLLMKLDESGIDRIYRQADEQFRESMLLLAERSIRLGTDLIFLRWYISKREDVEISFPKAFIYKRMLAIAGNIAANTKSDPYLAFIRKFLFGGKKPRFIEIMRNAREKDAKELFDTFMASSLLSDYQRDQIRIQVYDIYPGFREISKAVYEYSTRQGIERKQSELNRIINKVLPELTAKIREAAEHGDLSENAEYKYSREQYRFMSSLAEELGNELSKAHPIDMDNVSGDKVEAGTVISIQLDDGTPKTYTVLGPLDVDNEGTVISYRSPLIEKISGLKSGEQKDGVTVISVNKFQEDK